MVNITAHVCTYVVFYFVFLFNKTAHVYFAHVVLLMYMFHIFRIFIRYDNIFTVF